MYERSLFRTIAESLEIIHFCQHAWEKQVCCENKTSLEKFDIRIQLLQSGIIKKYKLSVFSFSIFVL